MVAVTNSRLDFGPWEQIFYGEFYGGLTRLCLGRSSLGIQTNGCQAARI
jgi:hypothetical protein